MTQSVYLVVMDVRGTFIDEYFGIEIRECFLDKLLAEKFIEEYPSYYIKEMKIDESEQESDEIYLIASIIREPEEYTNDIWGLEIQKCFFNKANAYQFLGEHGEYEYHVEKIKLSDSKYQHVKENKEFSILEIHMGATFDNKTREYTEFLKMILGTAFRNPEIYMGFESVQGSFGIPEFKFLAEPRKSPAEGIDMFEMSLKVPVSSDPTIQEEIKTRFAEQLDEIFFLAVDLFKQYGYCSREAMSFMKEELKKRDLFYDYYKEEIH